MTTTTKALAGLALAAFCAAPPAGSQRQTYPTKSVQVISAASLGFKPE